MFGCDLNCYCDPVSLIKCVVLTMTLSLSFLLGLCYQAWQSSRLQDRSHPWLAHSVIRGDSGRLPISTSIEETHTSITSREEVLQIRAASTTTSDLFYGNQCEIVQHQISE